MWQSGLSCCLFALPEQFLISHAGIVSSFFPSLSTAAFCVRNVHRLWHRNKLVHQIKMCHRSKPFTWNVIHDFAGWEGSARCLEDSWDSTLQSYIVSNSLSLPIFGCALVFTMLGCLSHGIAGTMGLSNFLLCIFWEFVSLLCRLFQ